MVDFINIRLQNKEALELFEKNRSMFPADRYHYNAKTGIVLVRNQDDAIRLWRSLGCRFPHAIDVITGSPEHEAVVRCYKGLPGADKDHVDFARAEVGCRVSVHIDSSRPDIQQKFWDAIYSAGPDGSGPRSARALSHEGLGNRLDDRQRTIAFELGKWSMMVVTDEGTYVSDGFMRLIEEEEKRKNRGKHRSIHKPSGPFNGR